MPRLRRSDKRRHEVTIELLNVLANMHVGSEAAELWERFWGGPAEGRAAFEALRHTTRCPQLGPVLGAKDGESYEAWLDRITADADDDADEP